MFKRFFLYENRVMEGTNGNDPTHVAIKPLAYLESYCRNYTTDCQNFSSQLFP